MRALAVDLQAADNPFTLGELCDTRADFGDFACQVDAERRRQCERHHLGKIALAQKGLDMVEARRSDLHQNFAGTGNWLGRIFDLDLTGIAISDEKGGFHG